MYVRSDLTASPARGAYAPRAGLNPWLKLLIGITAIIFFIFGFGRLMALLPGADHMARTIDERGLRATAIYYTDLEESAEGSEYIRHSLENPPVRRHP